MHMNPCIAGLSVQMANLPDDFDFIIGNYHFVETPRCPHCGGKTVQRGDELYCYSCHMWRKVDETHHAQSEWRPVPARWESSACKADSSGGAWDPQAISGERHHTEGTRQEVRCNQVNCLASDQPIKLEPYIKIPPLSRGIFFWLYFPIYSFSNALICIL